MSETPVPSLAAELLPLFDEAFETHTGIFLDKGTTLFETIDALDAAAASRAVGPDSATIAAHVEHVTFYLDVAEQYVLGTLQGKPDWKAIWRTTRAVTPERWDEIRAALRASHARVRARWVTPGGWPASITPADLAAFFTHTAFHLGAIRQILHVRGSGA